MTTLTFKPVLYISTVHTGGPANRPAARKNLIFEKHEISLVSIYNYYDFSVHNPSHDHARLIAGRESLLSCLHYQGNRT